MAGSGCNYTIARNWTAVDSCGNVGAIHQVINVVPPPLPVILNLPPDTITIACNETTTLAPGNLQYSNIQSGLCLIAGSMSPTILGTTDECGGILTIVWDTSLICGITLSHSQIVIVTPSSQAAFINPLQISY